MVQWNSHEQPHLSAKKLGHPRLGTNIKDLFDAENGPLEDYPPLQTSRFQVPC